MTGFLGTVKEVVDNDLCLGCGARASRVGGRGAMALSADGFLRPTAPDILARDRADDFCPGVGLQHDSAVIARDYDCQWGPIKRLGAGYASDAAIRFLGSSGGAISAICVALLESGAISFVWHTKADPHDPIGNVSGPSRTREEIIEGSGSRYGPSSPLAGLEDALMTGEKFAFVGKPCDAAAIRKLARVDPRIARQIPVVLSFFCAGVPSRKGTEQVIKALGAELADVKSFRYRGEGWPGLARVTRHDGTSATMDYNASWGTILNRHLQFRCKICADGTGEFADIVCADAWYGKDGYPDFAERDGRSLIVARTETGARLLQLLEAEGKLSIDPLDVESVEKMQPYQAYRKRNALARCLALRLAGRLAPNYRGLGLGALARRHSWRDQMRNFVGTFRRAFRVRN